MKRSLILSLLFLSAHADAAPLSLADFAYAFELKTPQPADVYSLTLPEAVYTRSLTTDLSDVAVFDAAGEAVPHVLQPPPQPTPEPAPVELAYFPLYENQASIPDETAVKLLANFEGSAAEFQKNAPAEKGAVIAYVVDTGKRDRTFSPQVDALQIAWTDNGTNLATHIDVDSSADLVHWFPLRRDAVLARMNFAQQRLELNRVELIDHPDRFLRILWPSGHQGSSITAVHALLARTPGPGDRQWINIAGHFSKDSSSPAFDYQVPGGLPIREINLALGTVDSFLRCGLFSRASPKQPWTARGTHAFYRARLADTELTNAAVAIEPTSDGYWHVTYDPQQFGFGSEIPWLRIGWTPHRLVFLARGGGPYTLAYGSARAHAQPPSEELNKALDALPPGTAQTGRAVRAGGADALLPPRRSLPWPGWLLWSSLLLGVPAVGVFALRRRRQLGNAGQ